MACSPATSQMTAIGRSLHSPLLMCMLGLRNVSLSLPRSYFPKLTSDPIPQPLSWTEHEPERIRTTAWCPWAQSLGPRCRQTCGSEWRQVSDVQQGLHAPFQAEALLGLSERRTPVSRAVCRVQLRRCDVLMQTFYQLVCRTSLLISILQCFSCLLMDMLCYSLHIRSCTT